MFLSHCTPPTVAVRFPRVCGDVPVGSEIINSAFGFSPRMRGCSSRRRAVRSKATVFPAYAGMFRSKWQDRLPERSFPRVCGDVPPAGL